MCIIIHKPAGVKLADDIYKNCFENNSDGGGLVFHNKESNKLEINKGFDKFDPFLARIKEVEDNELIIHFRIASPGMVIDEENCHPFYCESSLFPQYSFALAHNGRLPWQSSALRSDTSHFCEEMLKPIIDRDPFFFGSLQTHLLMESFIGSGNKLAIIRLDSKKNKSEVYIVNRKAGTDAHGCWFSNTSYLPKYKPATYYGGTRSHDEFDFDSGRDYSTWRWDASINKLVEIKPATKQATNGEAGEKKPEEGGKGAPQGSAPSGEVKDSGGEEAEGEGKKLITFPDKGSIKTGHEAELERERYFLTKNEMKRVKAVAFKYLATLEVEIAGGKNWFDPIAMEEQERLGYMVNDLREAFPNFASWSAEKIYHWVAFNDREALEALIDLYMSLDSKIGD